MVIVRRALIWNFMGTTIFRKFRCVFCYCIPNCKVYKKTLVKNFKNGQKLFYLLLYCKICSSMRSFEWYNLNVYHIMGSWWKSSFSKNTQKHVFCALSLNISNKIHFLFGEKILVTLDTYAKKN